MADERYPVGAPQQSQQGVGDPAGFARLWTPHRMAYIDAGGTNEEGGCPFCRIPALPDSEGLVVARGEHCYAVLNLFPYNPGHLMALPYRHVAGYDELTDVEVAEVAGLTRAAILALRAATGAPGFNVGMNLGAVAGAGIAEHLHQHVVPRWGGDTNFMPVVGKTRVLPQLLADTRERLVAAWPEGWTTTAA
ncbi:MAG TPA: HIT domain-containing protein [Mycobacteriales bacterium]|nr:HIT domain-containing protein [Mycobacteriales bacterium]